MKLFLPNARAWKVWSTVATAVAAAAAGVWLGWVRPAAATDATPPPAMAVRAARGPAVTVRIATYNIRNYNSIDRRAEGGFRPGWPKPEAEKAALRAVIRDAQADVLALQEIGDAPYLEELRRDLANEGLAYAYSAIVNGPDPDRHVAVLSKLPLSRVNARDKVAYKFNGSPELLKRGLLELGFVTAGRPWTLYVLHLKSRITENPADPNGAVMREGEARAARDLIRREQLARAGALVAVAGDFNDARNSPPVRRFLEVSSQPLLLVAPAADSRGEAWTEYYHAAEQYTRPDYILLSPALAAMQENVGGVVDIPDAATASDHRLVWVDLVFPEN